MTEIIDKNGPAVDEEFLEQYAELDEPGELSMVSQLAERFLSVTPERVAKIRNGVKTEDLVAVKNEAHALKSSCGNLGAKIMSAICYELEKAGKTGDTDVARRELEHLEKEFVRVQEALQKHVAA